MMKRTIIIFSNPFGYGPTGAVIPIMEGLLKNFKQARIVFVGSGLCMEITKDVLIDRVLLDERDVNSIKAFLKTVKNPYVISSQNKYSIKAAKDLYIPCAYIDTLSWFWKEIPKDHLIADEIFWPKFPGVENQLPVGQDNIHIVSGIFSMPQVSTMKENQLLVHIGGAKYPFDGYSPRHYLNLIAKCVDDIASKNIFCRIICAGGSDALKYLRERTRKPTIKVPSLSNGEFAKRLSESTHLITTGGIQGTLEAFSAGIPTSFLPPLNLTQYALVRVLKKFNACPQYMDWDQCVRIRGGLSDLSEEDAIVQIGRYAKEVDENRGLSIKFVNIFSNMAEVTADKTGQETFVKNIGSSGAEEMIAILKERWALS